MGHQRQAVVRALAEARIKGAMTAETDHAATTRAQFVAWRKSARIAGAISMAIEFP